MKNKEYRITQIYDFDEHIYMTTIWFDGMPIACGFGYTPEKADTDCIEKFKYESKESYQQRLLTEATR